MRIISGILKGRRFSAPQNVDLRPTTDRAKENLFNSLAFKIDWTNSQILDLFSGTGNIAFEFYSRGCPMVYSIDKDQKCIDYQKKVSKDWNIKGMHFMKAEAIQFIQSATQRFDLVFADPPYALANMDELVETIFNSDILNEMGMVILEHDTTNDFRTHSNFERQLKYGQTIFSIFKL